MGRELDHLARFLHMAVEYKEKIRFKGQFFIEPKPKEPTKHQYDFDAASCHAFLMKYGLVDHLKLNIEANHATLAGPSFLHELEYAAANGLLGSVDANRGDELLGWDTDQFPTNLYETTLAMCTPSSRPVASRRAASTDTQLRRQSIDPEDLFHAHRRDGRLFARGLRPPPACSRTANSKRPARSATQAGTPPSARASSPAPDPRGYGGLYLRQRRTPTPQREAGVPGEYAERVYRVAWCPIHGGSPYPGGPPFSVCASMQLLLLFVARHAIDRRTKPVYLWVNLLEKPTLGGSTSMRS